MAVHIIEREQFIPADVNTVWNFFSNPANLAIITPPAMKFKQTSVYAGNKIYAGLLIRYRVSPFSGFTVKWLTEITHMDEGRFFVDEQRMGPFAFWQHQHHFEAVDGGTKMLDTIHYRVPGWWLGTLMNRLFVAKRLKHIFDFRRQKITELWGEWTGGKPTQ